MGKPPVLFSENKDMEPRVRKRSQRITLLVFLIFFGAMIICRIMGESLIQKIVTML